jgi:hypothetical protein
MLITGAKQEPPGPQRNETLKVAGQFRCRADAQGIVFAQRGRPKRGLRRDRC